MPTYNILSLVLLFLTMLGGPCNHNVEFTRKNKRINIIIGRVLFVGVLARAKNSDRLFWEEKFDGAKHALKVPCFCFLISLGEEGGNFFFIFP